MKNSKIQKQGSAIHILLTNCYSQSKRYGKIQQVQILSENFSNAKKVGINVKN